VAYIALGARPDFASAMLYSLGAMATYGHANLYLAEHWQPLGTLEAVNSMMLFGLTTAFLFSVLQSSYRIGAKEEATNVAALVPVEPAKAPGLQ
jgi:hypothetical protein